MRIQLVDDHALFRQSLRVLLTINGHEVVGTRRPTVGKRWKAPVPRAPISS